MAITIKNDKQKIGRNDPCPCESGLKYKYCHGDMLKRDVCNRFANEKMVELIKQEQIRKGMRCEHGILKTEHCPNCKIGD